ncbi:MAG TPA: GNAT family N-acetyltransferase, partial [Candidatus Binatus sp.]|nr:GNAT family N-acetyltransferase [Candidatus Binatus sp.]
MNRTDIKVFLEPIDRSNHKKLFNMHVRPEQVTFVTPPRWTLARCYVKFFGDNFEHRPHLIRAGDEVVGYATTACDPDSADNYWIDDIMIDADHQGKGYGRAAMVEVLKMIVARYPNCRAVQLTCFR